jgi:hypothetical protein
MAGRRPERTRQLAEMLKRAEWDAEKNPWSQPRREKVRTLKAAVSREEQRQAETAGQMTLL